MLIAPLDPVSAVFPGPTRPSFSVLPGLPVGGRPVAEVRCAGDADDEDEDLGDEEDLTTADPVDEEESTFDDFDDEFDDDFEEEENDPDWDHPDDADSDEPPPGKQPGKKK
jgi:hypothetical protein